MSISRRDLLQLSGGVVGGSSLAGCSYFDEERSTSINVGNRSEERKTVGVTVFDPESDTRSVMFGEEIELAPVGEDPTTEVFRDAFETRRALIEVRILESDMQQQFTYQPSPACETRERDEILEIRFNNPYSAEWRVGCEGE